MNKKTLIYESESNEQIALFQWAEMLSNVTPELSLLFHIPNGGKRDIQTAKRMKLEGVKSGVPDICLPVSKGIYHGLFIELKVEKNTVSTNQRKWLEQLNRQGYLATVCFGFEAAKNVITDYLKLKD